MIKSFYINVLLMSAGAIGFAYADETKPTQQTKPSNGAVITTVSPNQTTPSSNNQNQSVNPMGEKEKIKKTLQDKMMQRETKNLKKETQPLLPATGKDQTNSVTRGSDKNIQNMNEVNNVNAEYKNKADYCENNCTKIKFGKPIIVSSGPSLVPGKLAPGYKPLSSMDLLKAPQGLQSEEQKEFQQKRDAFNALTPDQKYDFCMKACIQHGVDTWVKFPEMY